MSTRNIRKTKRYSQFIFILAIALMALCFINTPPCEAKWKKKRLGGGGSDNSIAVNSSGYPHISYLDDSDQANYILRHSFFDGQTWKKEIVDSGDVGWYTAIKVDSLDHAHICYRAEHPSSSLKYAYFNGSSWSTTNVESGGYSNSIAIDGNNSPHISHITSGNELRYVRHDGSDWVFETVAPNALWFGATSLALTPSGTAYITFSDFSLPRRLYLATNASGSWEVSYLADGRQASLTLDSSGNPHILFFSEATQELTYTRYNGSTWVTDSIGPFGVDSPSIAIDKYDHAHVSFGASIGGPDVLIFGYHNGQEWLAAPLQKNSGYATSIAVDKQGFPHIASMRLRGSGSSSLDYFYYSGVRLKVSKKGKGSGTVTGLPGDISCGPVCTVNYMPTTTVVLTAQPDLGSTFAGWTGCSAPSDNQCTVVILEKNVKIKARFDKTL